MPPRIAIFGSVLLVLLATVPFAVIFWVRSAPGPSRPVHIVQDMDFQPRFNTQTINPLFQDQRAMRPQIPGVVATNGNAGGAHFEQGGVDGTWAANLPSSVPMSMETLKYGQSRYNIYCTACHGYSGFGDGIVNQRALALMSNADGPVLMW